MNWSRRKIEAQIARMKTGDCLKVAMSEIHDAYSWGWPSIYNSPEQAFLSSQVGSGCGAIRIEQDPLTSDYIISRHEESNKRFYIDPDREHLFKRMQDGTLELQLNKKRR